MIQVNRIYLIFNRLVTKKFLVDTSDKVYKETNKGLEWHKDADKYGNFIINKHKSDVGIFIPWKELSK